MNVKKTIENGLRVPNGYWTKDRCEIETLKYTTKKEFRINSSSAYRAMCVNGWHDEIGTHLINFNTNGLLFRYIYVFEFHKTNSVYIGLTWDIESRERQHINREKYNTQSSVYKHISENGLSKNDYILIDYGYYESNVASKIEGNVLEMYKIRGWNIINKSKTGGLGGNRLRWTKQNCTKEALKYKTRSEFRHKASGAYKRCRIENWLDDVCSHMTKTKYTNKKPRGYWTKQNCIKEALKYKTRKNFHTYSKSCYNACCKNKWLNEVCTHMV